MEGFNSHLNMEQMNKALISLNDMYEKAAQHGQQNENGKHGCIVPFLFSKNKNAYFTYLILQNLNLERIICSP